MVTGYLIFLLYYICWTLALLGIGSAIRGFIRSAIGEGLNSDDSYLSLPIDGILGMAAVTVVATLLNFFIPISLNVSFLIMIAGLAIFIVNRKSIISLVTGREKVMLIGFSLLIFLVIPLTWVNWYDTGLYHLPTIKWIIESPVPPGLANLQGRFGFNNSWLMLSACIDQWVVYLNKPYFLANGILMSFYGSAILLDVKRKFFAYAFSKADGRITAVDNGKKRYNFDPGDIFLVLTSIAMVYPGLMLLTSPSPDLPIMLFTLLVTFLVIKDFEYAHRANGYALLTVAISIYALTIKLSAIPLLLTLILLFFRDPLARYFPTSIMGMSQGYGILRQYAVLSMAAITLLLPWLARGVLLSGCLIFPFLIGYFPGLKWAVPAPLAASEVKWTTAWARSPDANAMSSLNGWAWVGPWLDRYFNVWGWTHMNFPGLHGSIAQWRVFLGDVRTNLITSLVASTNPKLFTALILFLACIFLLAYLLLSKKAILENVLRSKNVWFMPLIISAVGVAFWFYSAPDLRFGFGSIYSFLFTVLSMLIFVYLYPPDGPAGASGGDVKRRIRWFTVVMACIILLYGSIVVYHYGTNMKDTGSEGFDFPAYQLNESHTVQGVLIYTAVNGEQQCWNGPLPNTPYFNDSLQIELSNTTMLPNMFWYEDKNSLPIVL